MANGTVRGKSWGGLHGRLPSADWPLKCHLEHRIPVDREAPGRQERQSARHQGGTRDHLDSLGGTREAGKDQLDSLGGTREAGKDQLEVPVGKPGRHQGGTRETCSTGLPIESRFLEGRRILSNF